jgi:hypothetical protein
MGIRTSNPPSYDSIFPIRRGTTIDIAVDTLIPAHRGLFVSTSSATTITFTNLDGTSCATYFPANISIVLPLQIKQYSASSTTGIFIYGLL